MKKNNQRKRQRIIFIVSSFLICVSALFFIITNFQDNIIFFYSPSELKIAKVSNKKIIRVGGLVKKDSVKYLSNLTLEFIVTDLSEDLLIRYTGIKPNLFREGQGIIAKGFLEGDVFVASELLAKHDEKYMPPEVAKSLNL